MDKVLMDQVQLISWIVAIIAGIIAAIMAINSYRRSIREREHDLRWKQANVANEFVNEVHEHVSSKAAIAMLDWFVIDKIDNYDKSKITAIKYEEVLAAIPKIKDRTFNDKEHYILECFDWFFYYIDRTEQHINDGLFRFDNVKFIFFPYYKKIQPHRADYEKFMAERCYLLAPDFWRRFESDPAFKNC